MESNLNIYQEERPWGFFRRFTDNTPSTVKIISVRSGERLSLQSHNKRSEFWYVTRGGGFFEINGERIPAQPGDEVFIEKGTKHRMSAGENGLEVLEISLGEFDEDDIIRYEDEYNRI
jgi:mannose-6-phosphate isomerase-like protein (cupin superfamily)